MNFMMAGEPTFGRGVFVFLTVNQGAEQDTIPDLRKRPMHAELSGDRIRR